MKCNADECLSHFMQLCNQSSPTKSDLGFLNMWREHENMGNFPLSGTDRNIWEDSNTTPDLIAIKRGRKGDVFSQFSINKILPIYHCLCGRYFKVGHDLDLVI
jgi:hypothetical protein